MRIPRIRVRIRILTLPQRIQPNRLESGIIQWMPVRMFWTILHAQTQGFASCFTFRKRDETWWALSYIWHHAGLAYLCLFCPWRELGIIKRRFIKLISFPWSLLTQRADDVSSYSIFQVKNKFVTIRPIFYIKRWIRTFEKGKKGTKIEHLNRVLYRIRETLHNILCAK